MDGEDSRAGLVGQPGLNKNPHRSRGFCSGLLLLRIPKTLEISWLAIYPLMQTKLPAGSTSGSDASGGSS